uniref:Metalloendopeptidase n=1 Tax=Parastrongyloides trichosuri TaxID=131310 RepID=A0A0N4Z1L3_PARTI
MITYSIRKDSEQFNSSTIESVIEDLRERTCISFIESQNVVISRLGFNFKYGKNYNCNTTNGPNSRDNKTSQYIYIGSKCQNNPGDILSLILRMVGIMPPVNRPDRDEYVSLNDSKVDEKYDFLFEKYNRTDVDLYGTGFDFGSITFPKNDTFGFKNGQAFTPLIPQLYKMMGQRRNLSFNDLRIATQIYCPNRCNDTNLICLNGGFVNPKNCGSCVCPFGLNSTTNCSTLYESSQNCTIKELIQLNNSKPSETFQYTGVQSCYNKVNFTNGKLVFITVNSVNTENNDTICYEGQGLEIKHRPDKGESGYRFCGNYSNIVLNTTAGYTYIFYNGTIPGHKANVTVSLRSSTQSHG